MIRTLFLSLAVGGLAMLPSARAAVMYVDADPSTNTTLADGTAWTPTTTGSTANVANVWRERPGFGNGGEAYQSQQPTNGDAPRLRTTITGLTPGGTYDIKAYFWGNSQSWRGRASLTDEAGSLPGYNVDHFSGSGFSPMTFVTQEAPLTMGLNPGPLSTDDGLDPATENGGYFANSVITATTGAELTLYEVSLGTTDASGGGDIAVYIDDLVSGGSSNRTWYDGVGYSLVPEPNAIGLAMLTVCSFGVIRKRQRLA